MELTDEILEKNGFVTNHGERLLKKYYYTGPKASYRIMVEGAYIPRTNVLGWMASGWNTDSSGTITNRASASVITTVEELQSVINLCKIDLLIYSE